MPRRISLSATRACRFLMVSMVVLSGSLEISHGRFWDAAFFDSSGQPVRDLLGISVIDHVADVGQPFFRKILNSRLGLFHVNLMFVNQPSLHFAPKFHDQMGR